MNTIFTDKKRIVIITGVLLFLLFLLIIINLIFSRKNPKKEAKKYPTPTTVRMIMGYRLPSKDTETFDVLLNNRLPVKQQDFELKYSYKKNKFVVYTKNSNGEKSFQEWLKVQSKDIQKFFKKNKDLFEITPEPTPNYQQRQLKSLENLATYLFTLNNQVEKIEKKNNPGTPTPTLTPTPVRQLNTVYNLSDLIYEVGMNVGVPPKVLEAMVYIDYSPILTYSSKEITKYSTPGSIIPDCGPDKCSLTGPMRLSIGIDSNGSPSCALCCSNGICLSTQGGCPNDWALYGNAVQEYGRYTHQPNPCNLRDNLYAAAMKLKKLGKVQKTTGWTKEETYRAVKNYYGNCSSKYKRLGSKTYCEYVWSQYGG